MSHSPDPVQTGPVPDDDRTPAAANGPQFELLSISRTLDDMDPHDRPSLRPGAVRGRLIWVSIVLVALLAFVGWMLVGPPLPR